MPDRPDRPDQVDHIDHVDRAAVVPVPPRLLQRTSSAGPSPPPAASSTVADALRARRRIALLERNLGWGLSGVGFVGLACGGVLFVTSYASDVRFDEGATSRTSGLIAIGAGIGFLIPGVILAVVGQRRLTEIDWRLREVIVAPTVAAIPGGAALGVSGRF
jgi:hypothetical protein